MHQQNWICRTVAVVGSENYWCDPMFAYETSGDLTLTDGSVAYHLAGDGEKAVGDLRWATSENITVYNALNLVVDDDGEVVADPAPMAKFYEPNTVVTLTAAADTLYKFGGWAGDVTGTEITATLTMDADKTVEAAFDKAYFDVELNVNMSYWAARDMFSPGVDSVDFAGNMNGWGNGPLMSDEDGDTVYTASMKIDENYPTLEWKFRINRSWDDATCEFPSGGANRSITVTQDTIITLWYNDEEPQVGIDNDVNVAVQYALEQNYPNPFNPSTVINFSLKNDGQTRLVVYDMLGREVATLVNKNMKAGYHSVVFNDINLASGLYIYKITSGSFSDVKKMMYLK